MKTQISQIPLYITHQLYLFFRGVIGFLLGDGLMVLVIILILVWSYFNNKNDTHDYSSYKSSNPAVERVQYESLDFCEKNGNCRGME